MKNIHVLTTDKLSRLHLGNLGLVLCDLNFGRNTINGQNIYITDDSKIKEVDWVLGDFPDNPIGKVISKYGQEFTAQSLNGNKHGLTEYDSKKIILTTDDQLIQNGIQAIDDEFLQWFVQNPSCEGVEVKRNYLGSKCLKCGFIENHDEVDTENCPKCSNTRYEHLYLYKIIIPQEEPKNTCPKCRTTDFETCHSIKCPMRKEEPKQELPIINGSYGCTIETFKQETIEEFIFKVPFDYNIKPKEVIDMCMKEQENIILTFRLGNFIDMINSLSDDTEKNKILKSVFNNRDGELLLESYKSMKSHYEK